MESPGAYATEEGDWSEVEDEINGGHEQEGQGQHRGELLAMEEEAEADEGREEDVTDEQDDSGEGARCVHVNDRAANAPAGFATNMTSTTKYTWWSFPFKNLYEQVPPPLPSLNTPCAPCRWQACPL
jgi:hypothetical protein